MNNKNLRPSSFTQLPFGPLVDRAAIFQWIREFLFKMSIDGSYLEFGVFNGESMKQAYAILRDQVRGYVGFDSFEGLPKGAGIDEVGVKFMPQFVEGNYRSTGLDFTRANILSTGVSPELLRLIPGFFDRSLTPSLQSEILKHYGKASVIHLDVDLYASTMEALEFSRELMQTGTWLLCDDYWCYAGASSFGTQRALSEFLAKHSDIKFQEYTSYQGWSKAFVVERL